MKNKIERIKIKVDKSGQGKVFIGKKEISNNVAGMTIIIKAGETPEMFLRVFGDLEIEGEVLTKHLKGLK